MRQFSIDETVATYHLRADGPAHEVTVPEFFVDGRAVSDLIGIVRGLAFMSCDLSPGAPAALGSAIARFTGRAAPQNQFGTPRIVLYRCHCGSDYCGVISFTLAEKDGAVLWQNVSYEDDDGVAQADEAERLYGARFVAELAFDKAQYLAEFGRYARARGLQ